MANLLRAEKVAGALGKKAPAWLCGGRSGFFKLDLEIANCKFAIKKF